jgi:phosphoglycolate phosphatase
LRKCLLVFDLDGTLVDSRRDIAYSANALIVHYGGRPLPEVEIGRMVGDGASVLVARALVAAGVPRRPEALAKFIEIYDAHLLAHTTVYDGMREALDALAPLGPAAVLTNKPGDATRRILDGLSLTPYFAHVIGGDGPFPRKPSPDGLLHLARVTDVSPADTVLIGDSWIDRETASRAGTGVCLARYGFGFAGFPLDRLDGTELAVDAPLQLVELLTGRLAREG